MKGTLHAVPTERSPSRDLERHLLSFSEEGYATFPSVVDPARLATLGRSLADTFDAARSAGELFAGGGTLSGHLNCFPGEGSRFVRDALEARGIFDFVRIVSGAALREPNVGCNFNLPGSHEQNEHVDGYADQPFLVVNVAVVETTIENGAMEVLPGTHRADWKYWELILARPERRRLEMSPGDVVVRTSTLWHRGMPNRTRVPRPMLAFTWEGGGSALADPYSVHGRRLTFLPNRFGTTLRDRVRERAFVAAPHLGKAFLMLQSLVGSAAPRLLRR